MLNALALRHTEGIEHADQVLRAEETHQIVLEGDVEAGRTRVALTSGTTAQLVVNATRLVALGANHAETTETIGFLYFILYCLLGIITHRLFPASNLFLQPMRLFARPYIQLSKRCLIIVLTLRVVLFLLFLRQCLD